MLRVALTTLGCKVNQADADALMARLADVAIQVPFDQVAEVYIVNSCTVTATADRQSRQMIHRARRLNPSARVYLTGCLAAVKGEGLVAAELDGAFTLAQQPLLTAQIREQSAGHAAGRADSPSPAGKRRSRPLLKIHDGCDNACSYCIVPRARGPGRSVLSPSAVRQGLERLAGQGFREVVLTGIHLGQYGRDLDPPVPLAALVRRLLDPPAALRIRLSSVEPREIDEDLISLLHGHPRSLCPHLHIPIQSGDDAILRAMNRPYRTDEVRALLRRIGGAIPDVALGTDLIAGFPGETEQQFERSLQLVREALVTHLHVFPYSPRPGTAAATMPRLADREVRLRASALRQAGQDRLRAFTMSQRGKVRPVLVERVSSDGLLAGITDNYIRVLVPGSADLVGRLLAVELQELRPGGATVMLGRAVD